VTTGGIRRRCRCRDEAGKDLGSRCPKLTQRGHGAWQLRQELEPTEDGTRRTFRRNGYATKTLAQDDHDQLRELINLADEEEDRDAIATLLMDLGPKDPLPTPEDVRRKLRTGQKLDSKLTVGDWLNQWIKQQTHLRKSTRSLYETQIRLYLEPKIGHVRLGRLTVGHLHEMFATIEDDNDAIAANNADRKALEQQVRDTDKRAEKRALRAQLAELPPHRRIVGGASQQRIRGCLRKAINDAIAEQLATFNAAKHITIQAKRHKPIIWTAERVAEWQVSGLRPGPVMVWTPAQAGVFLDYVAEHDQDFEPLWHLAAYRGPRRGEMAGLKWTEVNLAAGTIEISKQLTEVDYDVEEGAPKSLAGERTIPVDDEGMRLLRAHRKRQLAERLRLGGAWVESGRVFTKPDGSSLRPSWIGDQFERLYTAAGLPPIRLHDLRHTAATLMLAAKVEMKIVQEILGHSAIAVTADLYTSVLPELAKAAAESTFAIVPRAPKKTLGHPSGTRAASKEEEGRGGNALQSG
jgi:integrase